MMSVIMGIFLELCPIFPILKNLKGDLSCKDTFSGPLWCPLKTGLVVSDIYIYMILGDSWLIGSLPRKL